MKRPRIAEALTDLAGIAGAGLVSWGVWQIYPPAGYVAGGILLMAGAWFAARGNVAPPAAPPPE
nr:hypothetical protein [uncultured Rhodopila sp.]